MNVKKKQGTRNVELHYTLTIPDDQRNNLFTIIINATKIYD